MSERLGRMFLQDHSHPEVSQVIICVVALLRGFFMVYCSEIDCLVLKHISIIKAKLKAALII